MPGTCDESPYVRAIGVVLAHVGPGDDYEVVAQLGPEDMRPIIGRAYYAPWWQIQFDFETIGWVADTEVIEYGNTALALPVVAPLINGNVPTPGAIWNPTPLPLPNCVPPTPTPTTIPTEASGPSASIAGGSGGGAGGSTGSGGGTTGDQLPAPTVGMVSAGVESNAPVIAQGESASPGLSVSSRNSEASRAASPTSAVNLLLPLAGLILISGGIVLALVSRKQGGTEAGKSNS